MADYDSMSAGELRKELRRHYPQCRGAFAASASKEDCLAILRAEKSPQEVMAAWKADLVGGGNPCDQTPADNAGANNDVDADAQQGSAQSGIEVEVAKVLNAVRTLNPSVAAYFDKQLEQARQAVMVSDRSSEIVAQGGKVRVAGIDVPVIFDRASLPSEKLAHLPEIDSDYRFDVWRAERTCGAVRFTQGADILVRLLLADQRVLLVGPPAVGKTSVVTQFSARTGWPVTRFNGNRDVTVQDFVGCYEASNGSTVWVDGPLPRAMREGHILILDEVDHMPAECSSILHSVLEPGGRLVITAKGGQVVAPHSNFRIVATANSAGFGDESGLHPNAQVQDAAFLSRFDAVLRVTWMTPANERDLLVKATGIDKADAELIVRVACDTRKAADNGDLTYPVTLRQTLGWARQARLVDLPAGFALAVLNKVPEQDAPAVAEIAQRHLGDRLGGELASTTQTE